MIYPVKIYNKFMKLIKTISKTELSETYWREKRRKKDVNLTPSELRNLGEKNLRNLGNIPKHFAIICRWCGKKAIMKSGRAVYCSEPCRNNSKKRRDNESKAKRNNTRRKSKKGIR
tara:strand:- start:187 stop:534 length:348 start_codon:yes stop_codon:yes gene_type:complete